MNNRCKKINFKVGRYRGRGRQAEVTVISKHPGKLHEDLHLCFEGGEKALGPEQQGKRKASPGEYRGVGVGEETPTGKLEQLQKAGWVR